MLDGTVAQLVKAREDLGLSQTEAARRAGVSRAWVNRLEAGRSPNPMLQKLFRYAAVLGVRVVTN